MRHIWILIFAALILVGPALVPLFDPEVGIARADDDDGGDDGGDDDGDDGDDDGDDDDGDDDDRDSPRRGERDARPRTGEQGGGFLRRLFPRREVAAPRRRAAPPPPVAVPDEIVVLSLAGEDLAALEAQGFALIETRTLNTLQTTAHRLRIPEATSLNAARDLVRARSSGAGADLNHYYRSEQGFDPDCNGLECPIRASFGWPIPDARAMSCGEGVRIGLVDTGLNPDHETFEGAALRVLDFKPLGDTASRALHGTAVAALLVGNPGTRSPGLLPQAEVVAIDPFHRVGGDERADVFSLMDAIDRIAQEDIDVMNLSLAGPPNAALAALLGDLIDSHNLVVVAAAGNAGPQSDPLYPSAIPEVIAVTAVDRDRNVYRRAVQGPHIDLAAPGVAVWTAASVRGAKWKTGTSFAVPFVSAAAALLRRDAPELTPPEIAARLKAKATDLGEVGEDSVFGSGLSPVINPLCQVQPGGAG